jgi:hypothetical protein
MSFQDRSCQITDYLSQVHKEQGTYVQLAWQPHKYVLLKLLVYEEIRHLIIDQLDAVTLRGPETSLHCASLPVQLFVSNESCKQIYVSRILGKHGVPITGASWNIDEIFNPSNQKLSLA